MTCILPDFLWHHRWMTPIRRAILGIFSIIMIGIALRLSFEQKALYKEFISKEFCVTEKNESPKKEPEQSAPRREPHNPDPTPLIPDDGNYFNQTYVKDPDSPLCKELRKICEWQPGR